MASRHGVEIRAATGADAPGLAELLAASGQAIPARDLAERLDALRLDHGTALIALAWGPPSGLVVFHRYRSLAEAGPMAAVTTLLVAPEERRRGLGRLLLKAASQAARSAGCGALALHAPPDRADLAAFCAATGFVATGTGFVRPLRKKG